MPRRAGRRRGGHGRRARRGCRSPPTSRSRGRPATPARAGAGSPRARTCDLDDLRPEVGQDLGAEGPGQVHREVEDPDAGEGGVDAHGVVTLLASKLIGKAWRRRTYERVAKWQTTSPRWLVPSTRAN